jgi:hypothetical protein
MGLKEYWSQLINDLKESGLYIENPTTDNSKLEKTIKYLQITKAILLSPALLVYKKKR